jgi:flavodoxin
MKTLVAYYSRTGSNREAAEALQKKLECDIEEIVDLKDRSGGWGMLRSGLDVLFRKSSRIKPAVKNPGDYDLTVVTTPVWGGTLPPATRAYLGENRDRFRDIALLSVSGSGKGNKDFISKFELAVGRKPSPVLLLSESDVKDRDWGKLIESFAKKIREYSGM